jgi:hypothetical protein
MQSKATALKTPKRSIRESVGSRTLDIINYVLHDNRKNHVEHNADHHTHRGQQV